jgi:hypothetical protein
LIDVATYDSWSFQQQPSASDTAAQLRLESGLRTTPQRASCCLNTYPQCIE